MIVAALFVAPIGIVHAGFQILRPEVLLIGVGVGALSSALPYVLEMYAMTRMPTRAFGIFMSVEPAIAALFGLALLGERLSPLQGVAIGCVMLASFGSALSSARSGA